MINLEGKNVLITGGGGVGVGEGVCRVLLSVGARLVINEKDQQRADTAAKKFPGALTIAADLTKTAEVEQMFERMEQEVGVVHGLVNNAGIGLTKPAHEVTEQEFAGLFDVDIKSVWFVSKLFVQQLLRNNQPGSIVNVSSVHAHSTTNKYAVYASAKAAVEGLTRGMAVELGQHLIRVNAIAPGYVHAEQNYALIRAFTDDPDQWINNVITKEQVIPREINSEDCGAAAAFFLSDQSRSITGQTLYVDNGCTIKLFSTV